VVEHVQADASVLCPTALGESKRRMMQAREAKGLQIAHNSEITRLENLWIVPSQSSQKKYAVDLDADPPTCTCPDYKKNDRVCKHIYAARYAREREGGAELPEAPKIAKRKYTQNWRTYHPAQVHEKARFQVLLHELCKGIEDPVCEYGRPRTPLADIIFAAALKVYSTVSTRRFCTDLQEAHARGYLSKAPSYNSVLDYFGYKALTPYLRQLVEVSSLPLKGMEQDFAVDSSGFTTCRYTRWFNAKYTKDGDADMHDWLKLHLMCGVRTHIVTSVEISDRHDNDYNFFEPLVKTTARGFKLREVSADKAYSGLSALRLVVDNGATPYIPFKKHATGTHWRAYKDKTGVWARLFHFFKCHEEEFYAHYHKRSNSETVFSMIKARFGERLRSKTKEAQTNEAILKVVCHNLCVLVQSIYELNLEPVFWQEGEKTFRVD
jgi:transposase